MKNKKAILTSVLSLAMCASVITGATFALATSNSEVNIAVQAGKVDVSATLTNLKTFSAKAKADNSGYDEAMQTEGATDTYGTFVNGGTAEIKDGTLTLDRMIHGDKATFDIVLENKSNIDIQYQTVIQTIEDSGLFAGLVVEIDGQQFNGFTAASDWKFLEGSTQIEKSTWSCSVSLPIDADSSYQGKSTKLAVSVNAVQGNAIVGTSISTEEELAKAIENNAETIFLSQDIVLTETQDLMQNKDVTIVGYGNKISRAESLTGTLFNIDETSSLTLADVTVDGGAQAFEVDMSGYPTIKEDSITNVVKTTEPAIVSNGTLVANNATFANNYSDGYNSSVRVLAGTAEFNGCDFSHNYSPNFGAAVGIGVEGAVTEYTVEKVVFNNCTFNGNITNKGGAGGGALYIANTKDVYIQSCDFINNCGMAYNCGGGAIFFGRNNSIQNSMKDDDPTNDLPFINAYIDDCLFEGNRSGNDGAAIHSESANLYITNSKFINNVGHSGSSSVGTISCMPYAADGKNPPILLECSMDKCEFIGNSLGGGAVFGNHATAVVMKLTNSLIQENEGTSALLIYEGDNLIENCRFVNNKTGKALFDIRTVDERYADVVIKDVTVEKESEFAMVPDILLDAQEGLNATCDIQGTTTASVFVKTTSGTSELLINGTLNGDVLTCSSTPVENVVVGESGVHNGTITDAGETKVVLTARIKDAEGREFYHVITVNKNETMTVDSLLSAVGNSTMEGYELKCYTDSKYTTAWDFTPTADMTVYTQWVAIA